MSSKPKEVRVEFSLTVNLGAFNSAKLGCMLQDEVLPGEEFEEKFDELYGKVRRKIRQELAYLTHEVKVVANGEQDG